MAHVPGGGTEPPFSDVDRRASSPSAVLAVDLGGALITAHRDGEPKLSALGVVYLVAAAVPLVWRRRWPIGRVRSRSASPRPPSASPSYPIRRCRSPLLVALFTVAAYEPRRRTVVVVLVAAVGSRRCRSSWPATPVPMTTTRSSYRARSRSSLGDRQRTRAAYLAAVEARARSLELDQSAAAERAVEAERARIARELHDVVAHHVSMIVVQAEAGAASATTSRS